MKIFEGFGFCKTIFGHKFEKILCFISFVVIVLKWIFTQTVIIKTETNWHNLKIKIIYIQFKTELRDKESQKEVLRIEIKQKISWKRD
jgi:hypothetical protein